MIGEEPRMNSPIRALQKALEAAVALAKLYTPPQQLAGPVQAALAMATPEQIQQAVMALAQAASASAGGQLKPDDLQALFGPQWATLVAMPGGAISLPPDQLQQLAASEAPHALAQLVSAPPSAPIPQPKLSRAPPPFSASRGCCSPGTMQALPGT